MSDQKLRELERHWRETKSVEDEAAYLRERVRVGDLTQERLELAAYCGSEGAQAACGVHGPIDAREWSHGLAAYGKRVCGRAAVVLAESVLDVWHDWQPEDRRIPRLLEVMRLSLATHQPGSEEFLEQVLVAHHEATLVRAEAASLAAHAVIMAADVVLIEPEEVAGAASSVAAVEEAATRARAGQSPLGQCRRSLSLWALTGADCETWSGPVCETWNGPSSDMGPSQEEAR